MIWPPNITIKKHSRARHVKLKASVKHGLELVVPKRFNQKEIPFILDQNRSWIEKQLLKIQSQLLSIDTLPTEISLPAFALTWQIEYVEIEKKLRLMSRPHQQELVLIGNMQNKSQCKELLINWAKKQARIFLIQKLGDLSKQIKLPFENAIIRDQTTRWGSCSSQKSISLNYKIVFLPLRLLEHIMIHELCHTVHMNHSKEFWRLVGSFDPQWEDHKRLLRKADQLIPGWVRI